MVAADKLAITRTKRDMSAGFPIGKIIKAEAHQIIPEMKARSR
jgi:hypothetical protein